MKYFVVALLGFVGCAERNEVIAVVEGTGGSGGNGPVLVATSTQPLVCGEGNALAVTAVDADGHRDVLVAGGCLSLYPGGGDGTLSAGTTAAPTFGSGLDVGDIDGDGAADVLGFDGQTTILLGDGIGGFVPGPASAAVGPGKLGDVALGAELDLVVRSANSIEEWTGDGSADFIGPHPIALAHSITDHALGDFGGEHHLDALVASAGVAVLLSQGDGSFHAPQAATHVSTPEAVRSVLAIDLDGDACDDAIAFDAALLRTLLGSCDGALVEHVAIPIDGAVHAAAGDVDGDDRADVVLALPGAVALLRGLGDGGLEAPIEIAVDGDPRAVAIADMNEDARSDVVVLTRTSVQLLASDGAGR